MTTGTVTMSLADVDKLRDSIKELEKELKKVEKQKEEIKAEKRVLKITVTKNYSQGNMYLLTEFVRFAEAEYRFSGLEHAMHSFFSRHSRKYEGFGYGAASSQEQKTEEYINFDDVSAKLRQEIEYKVFEELEYLRKEKNSHAVQYEALRQQYKNDQNAFVKEHNEKYLELMKKYEDLKNDKDTRKTEDKLKEQIQKLEEELAKVRAKWYYKIF